MRGSTEKKLHSSCEVRRSLNATAGNFRQMFQQFFQNFHGTSSVFAQHPRRHFRTRLYGPLINICKISLLNHPHNFLGIPRSCAVVPRLDADERSYRTFDRCPMYGCLMQRSVHTFIMAVSLTCVSCNSVSTSFECRDVL